MYCSTFEKMNTVIVFDDYPTEGKLKSMKSADKAHISRLHNFVEVLFDESMFL